MSSTKLLRVISCCIWIFTHVSCISGSTTTTSDTIDASTAISEIPPKVEPQQQHQQQQHQQQHQQQCPSSSNNKKSPRKKYQWNPSDYKSHRCNIERITFSQLYTRFGERGLPPMYHSPIIIFLSPIPTKSTVNNKNNNNNNNNNNEHTRERNRLFRNITSIENLLDNFITTTTPNTTKDQFQIVLSSSNSFSHHRRTLPLHKYLQQLFQNPETFPDQLSNETWYFFGETYSLEWRALLRNYQLPPCVACVSQTQTQNHIHNAAAVALSFGIGNRGSGVQWHTHGPGFSETIHGRKHWLLYPPDQKPNYHPDYTSRYWMEYTYPDLISKNKQLPYECSIGPGEIIYFPNQWHHATINLDVYTAFVSTFTQEHQFVDELI